MTCSCDFCSGLTSPSSRAWIMPIMPFIGVRISWLILARNSSFIALAFSAAARATANCLFNRRRLNRAVRIAAIPINAAAVSTVCSSMIRCFCESDCFRVAT